MTTSKANSIKNKKDKDLAIKNLIKSLQSQGCDAEEIKERLSALDISNDEAISAIQPPDPLKKSRSRYNQNSEKRHKSQAYLYSLFSIGIILISTGVILSFSSLYNAKDAKAGSFTVYYGLTITGIFFVLGAGIAYSKSK